MNSTSPGREVDIYRKDLLDYSDFLARTIVFEPVLDAAQKYDHKKNQLRYAARCVVGNLVVVGEEDAAFSIASNLMDRLDFDDDERIKTWMNMAERGSDEAEKRLREALGLSIDSDDTQPIEIDISNPQTLQAIMVLYKNGDASMLPYLHEAMATYDEKSCAYAVRHAVKLYQLGDETAFELIKTSAKRALKYALAQEPELEEATANDAGDFAQIVKAITSALRPNMSSTESLYVQADIALRYFVEDLLKAGEIDKADEIQSLILSRYYAAQAAAARVKLGFDPDGLYTQSALDYLGVFGEETVQQNLEIVASLIEGGNKDIAESVEMVFDESIKPEEIDQRVATAMLVALHHAGDERAHARLYELLSSPKDVKQLIASLKAIGFKDDAAQLAQREFANDPTYDNASQLLCLQYDRAAMDVIETTGIASYHYSIIDVVESRARLLFRLTDHILSLEGKPEADYRLT